MTPSNEPHVIRLRGPCQVTRRFVQRSPIREFSGIDTSEARLPIRSRDLVHADFHGQIELRRNFNWPEPLGYRESLWLVVQAAAWPRFSVDLNGQPLDTVAGTRALPAAWEITPRIATHNQLQLTWNIVALAADNDFSWVEVHENLSWVDVQLEVRLDVGPQD